MVHIVRNRETTPRRHVDPLTKAAAVRICAAKMKASAQVRMPALAEFTTPTWLGGIYRHPRAGLERFEMTVHRIGPNFFDYAREFMAQD